MGFEFLKDKNVPWDTQQQGNPDRAMVKAIREVILMWLSRGHY